MDFMEKSLLYIQSPDATLGTLSYYKQTFILLVITSALISCTVIIFGLSLFTELSIKFTYTTIERMIIVLVGVPLIIILFLHCIEIYKTWKTYKPFKITPNGFAINSTSHSKLLKLKKEIILFSEIKKLILICRKNNKPLLNIQDLAFVIIKVILQDNSEYYIFQGELDRINILKKIITDNSRKYRIELVIKGEC